MPFFAFLSPLGGLGATYDDHLRLRWKARSDLALIELFSLGVTAEAV